jgi:enoyl-CoA hydratase/carnithine racemase
VAEPKREVAVAARHLPLDTDRLLAYVEDGVGWMVFNNPERLNAVNFAMKQAIPGIMQSFDADEEVRVVVISGTGERAFVSGADVTEFGELRSTPEAIRVYDEVSNRMWDSLRDLRKPLIALIRGFALGGGLETALRADMRIAAENAEFGIPAVKIGLGFSLHNTDEMMRVLGPTRTADLLLTGRRMKADEALASGLVNQVVPLAEIDQVVKDLAAEIASNAPLAVRVVKANMRAHHLPAGERDEAQLEAMAAECYASEDYAEGRLALSEKRKPHFTGR